MSFPVKIFPPITLFYSVSFLFNFLCLNPFLNTDSLTCRLMSSFFSCDSCHSLCGVASAFTDNCTFYLSPCDFFLSVHVEFSFPLTSSCFSCSTASPAAPPRACAPSHLCPLTPVLTLLHVSPDVSHVTLLITSGRQVARAHRCGRAAEHSELPSHSQHRRCRDPAQGHALSTRVARTAVGVTGEGQAHR